MCTGTGAPHCPAEPLAWRLYDEHGYRPRELRPCLTAPHPLAEPREHRVRRFFRRRG